MWIRPPYLLTVYPAFPLLSLVFASQRLALLQTLNKHLLNKWPSGTVPTITDLFTGESHRVCTHPKGFLFSPPNPWLCIFILSLVYQLIPRIPQAPPGQPQWSGAQLLPWGPWGVALRAWLMYTTPGAHPIQAAPNSGVCLTELE